MLAKIAPSFALFALLLFAKKLCLGSMQKSRNFDSQMFYDSIWSLTRLGLRIAFRETWTDFGGNASSLGRRQEINHRIVSWKVKPADHFLRVGFLRWQAMSPRSFCAETFSIDSQPASQSVSKPGAINSGTISTCNFVCEITTMFVSQNGIVGRLKKDGDGKAARREREIFHHPVCTKQCLCFYP